VRNITSLQTKPLEERRQAALEKRASLHPVDKSVSKSVDNLSDSQEVLGKILSLTEEILGLLKTPQPEHVGFDITERDVFGNIKSFEVKS